MILFTICLFVYNNWHQEEPKVELVPEGQEPLVGIIIPTWNEPVFMIEETILSIISQEWPLHKMVILVTDDGKNPEVAQLVRDLSLRIPELVIGYNVPPAKGSLERQGEAKAGNMNSAVQVLTKNFPEIEFIETRDADDLIGDQQFLKKVIGQLLSNPRTAYVQTIKEVMSSEGDPFGNMESLFYRVIMLGRHAKKSVFPCGSGLVWRKKALIDIGGFPSWNLVEDLQSGIEAISRGWKGGYNPIVGAIGQVAPEDIPNVYKQRGTWALDTMRLFLWKLPLMKGLSFNQRLQFAELGIFYLLSIPTLIFIVIPIISLLFGIYPLVTDHLTYAIRFWPFAVAVETYLVTLARGLPYEDMWRSRQMWIGLAPVYAKACIMALINGPHKKPSYKVTRKVHESGWYWKETIWQYMLLGGLIVALVKTVSSQSLITILNEADLGSIFWALYFILGLSGIVQRSWFQYQWSRKVKLMAQKTAQSRLIIIPAIALVAVCGLFSWTFLNGRPTTQAAQVANTIPERSQNAYVPSIVGQVGLGAHLDGTPWDDFVATTQFEEIVGKKMTYTLWFQAWGDSDRHFIGDKIRLASAKGLTPVITWEPWKRDFQNSTAIQPEYSLNSIYTGKHDAYIRDWARGSRNTGVPIIIRFAHEQSTDPFAPPSWYPWQGDPEGYKQAFRHIVGIFREEGATNVQFMWSGMWLEKWGSNYYPGDDVVDYIGTTVLNHGTVPDIHWANFRSFDDYFGSQYKAAEAWGKPIVITELGSAEQGGNKPVWIYDMFTGLKIKYPLVTGVLMLEVHSDREWPAINWSITSTPQTFEAFKIAVSDPYFK